MKVFNECSEYCPSKMRCMSEQCKVWLVACQYSMIIKFLCISLPYLYNAMYAKILLALRYEYI